MKLLSKIMKNYTTLIIKTVVVILILTWFSPMYYFAPDRSYGFFYYPKMATIYEDYFSFIAWMKLLMPMVMYLVMISKELQAIENKYLICGFFMLIDLITEIIFALIMIEATYQNAYDVVSASLRPTGFFWISILGMLIGIITSFTSAIGIIKGSSINSILESDSFCE